MAQKIFKRPLVLALGAAFAATLAGASVANAADNPFAMTELSIGYMVVDSAEGKCGANKVHAKSDGEGKCGANKTEAKSDAEGKCGGSK